MENGTGWVIVVVVALMVGRVATLWSRGYRARKAWTAGFEALKHGDVEAAEAAFRKCVRLIPSAAPAHRALGRILAHRGGFAEAEEHLQFATQLEPRNGEGHLDLGLFLAMCVPQRAEEAVDALAKAVEFAPRLREQLAAADALAGLRTNPRFRDLLEPPTRADASGGTPP